MIESLCDWGQPIIVKDKKLRYADATPLFWKQWHSENKRFLTDNGVIPFPIVEGGRRIWKVEWTTQLSSTSSSGLLPHQGKHVEAIAKALRSHNSALDASDMGTGKTYTSVKQAEVQSRRPIVLCPKALKSSWYRGIKHFDIDYIDIMNYEQIKNGNTPYLSREDIVVKRGKKELRKTIYEWFLPEDAMLIIDEVQWFKAIHSLNAELLIQAKTQNIMTLMCSATAASNPLDMKALGYHLNLHNLKDFYPWCIRNGCVKTRFGFKFVGGQEILKRIHAHIFPEYGSRMRIADIPEFPDMQLIPECYDMDEADDINKIYAEMQQEINDINEQELTDMQKRAGVLTARLRALQRTEMLKVPFLADQTEDLIDQGFSVCIFLNFNDSIDALATRLGTTCTFYGRNSAEINIANRTKFCNDNSRKILINGKSGGTGTSFEDIRGEFPRYSLIAPTDSAEVLRQITGRTRRASSKSKSIARVVYTANTVEENVCANVQAKLRNLDILNDADLAVVTQLI